MCEAVMFPDVDLCRRLALLAIQPGFAGSAAQRAVCVLQKLRGEVSSLLAFKRTKQPATNSCWGSLLRIAALHEHAVPLSLLDNSVQPSLRLPAVVGYSKGFKM